MPQSRVSWQPSSRMASQTVTIAPETLITTKQCYANIECELLTCAFVAECFHVYVFCYAFTIKSSCKPLGQIRLKTLVDAPSCLQRMLLQQQTMLLQSIPARQEMLVANSLSQYVLLDTLDIPLDIAINHMHITSQDKIEFQAAIHDDPLLNFLTDMIIAQSPVNISHVPHAPCP